MKRILLVQPDFPLPKKRKVSHESIPTGLLKIGSYLRNSLGHDVRLVFGKQMLDFVPDEIWISSLFTYWSRHVHEAARYYHSLCPKAKIVVGGIYASLLPEQAKLGTKADEVFVGVHEEAEKWCREFGVDYSFLSSVPEVQILHGMRGCFRRCKFCGTWRIEPEESFDYKIHSRVRMKHVVFYDNNFLRNPNIVEILRELANMKIGGKRIVCESQSGFDGRILTLDLAKLLKKANFINPRIAWDNSYQDVEEIGRQILLLEKAGYKSKDIYVFMLFNWKYSYPTLEMKRVKCWEWGVQISDCRFRPLDQMKDEFDSRRSQKSREYFIHPKWNDAEVKLFRSNVRKHNICIRHGFRFHSAMLERKKTPKERYRDLDRLNNQQIRDSIPDAWFPCEFHPAPVSTSLLESYNESLTEIFQ